MSSLLKNEILFFARTLQSSGKQLTQIQQISEDLMLHCYFTQLAEPFVKIHHQWLHSVQPKSIKIKPPINQSRHFFLCDDTNTRRQFSNKGTVKRIKDRFQSLSHFLLDALRAETPWRLDEDREDRGIIEQELWGFCPFCNSKHDDKLTLKQCWNKQYVLCGKSTDWSMGLLSSWSHERATSSASETDDCSIRQPKALWSIHWELQRRE